MMNKRYSDSVYQIQNILRNRESFIAFYDGDVEALEAFLLDTLRDKRFDLETRAEIAWSELYKIINQQIEGQDKTILIHKKGELQNILFDCLADKLSSLEEFQWVVVELYIKNLEEIKPGSRLMVFTKEANSLMREFILSNPKMYIGSFLLRRHPEPSFEGRWYNMDPFLPNYFEGDWVEIVRFITSKNTKELFNRTEEERKFYDFLVEKIHEVKNNGNDKFWISDKKKIELIAKFIEDED